MNKTNNNLSIGRHLAISVLLFMCSSIVGIAQNGPKLNEYTFGEGLTFSNKDEYSINLRGYIQPMMEVLNYNGNDETDNLTRFRMRRARLRLTGDIKKYKLDYRFQFDLSGSSEVGDDQASLLLDAWIRYGLTKQVSISFGQKTTSTDNLELSMGSQTLQLVERSRLTSAFSSIREFGVFIDGSFKTGGSSYLRPSIAITNGDGLNVYGVDHGGFKYGVRVDFLPFGLFTRFGQFRQVDMARENIPKLLIGATYSYNDGMSSRRGRNSGAILYLNNDGEETLPDYTKYGIDFLFKYRGFSVLGEFVGTESYVPRSITQRVRTDGSTATTFDVNGTEDVKNYVRGRMMLGKGYNIQLGYLFKSLWSIDARYTHLEADDNSFLNNGTFYNRPNHYTVGTTKYLDRSYGIKIQGDITYTDLAAGSNDIYGNPISGNEWTVRLMTSIAF